jgi:hypothetical protein
MRQFGLVLLILMTALSTHLAMDLPAPPDGFKWQEVKAIEGAVLVPDGWHFRAETAKGKLAYFITEEDFTPPEKYRVGASLNVFLGNPDAPAQIEQYLGAQAKEHGVELAPGKFGPFLTLQCRYDLARTSEHEAIRVVYLGIVNPKTHATYLVLFESPVQRWERAWSKGEVIVKNLALNGKV